MPPITGIEKVNYLTNENIIKLDELPKSMTILGGGAIGVELAQALIRLGVHIQLVEMMDTILFREEEELVNLLHQKLVEEGINIHTSSKAIIVEEINSAIHLTVEKNGEAQVLQSDTLFVALGRKANMDNLGLENAGIKIGKKAIDVNEYLQTEVQNIYVVGDVVGPYQFSHMANVQGILATQNAILPLKRKINYNHIAWCTFTDPELAHAGMTEKEARLEYGDNIRVYTHDYNHLDRAKTKPGSIGKVKLVLDNKGKVLGASILGDSAGEIISEIQVVKTFGMNLSKLSSVIHPYPTYGEVLNKIAKKVAVDNILNHGLLKIIRRRKKR